MTRNDPAVRRTLARQLWKQREMRRAGAHVFDRPTDSFTNAASTDVRKTWQRFGWRPGVTATQDVAA